MRRGRKRSPPVSLAGPGYDGKMELKTRQVGNPYDAGETEIVQFNMRESNARTLRLGEAQEQAYNRILGLWHQAGRLGYGSMDTAREPVDGGGTGDPWPLRAVEAAEKLNKLREALGRDDWKFIEITCLGGLGYQEVARIMFVEPGQKQIDRATGLVKTAYDHLMVVLGLGVPDHITRLHNYK